MIYTDEKSEQLLFDYSIFQPRRDLPLLTVGNSVANHQMPLDGLEEGYDFVFDFDKDISKADKLDYEVAAASGLLTAILDIFWVEDFSLVNAREWGSKEVEKLVVDVAKKKAGFVPRSTDSYEDVLQKAIRKLEKEFPIPADILSPKFGDGYYHHLRDFVHHPTILGLFFSILSQFTEYGFGTDVNGKFKAYRIPKEKLSEKLIGDTFEKKIIYGIVNWAIHLISDMDGSSDNPGKGTGIPGPVLAFFKEMSSLPLINNIQVKYKYKGEEKDIRISAYLQKVFDGTLFADHDEVGNIIKGTEKPLDFRTELGIAKGFIKSTIPVIANECIVRAFYFIRRFLNEIKKNNINSLREIAKLDPNRFLPYNNRALTRMLTVSSGTFMMIVTAKDAVAAAIKSRGDKKKFAKYFFLNINYVGIVRFTFACKNDAGYIAEDVKKEYEKYIAEKRREAVEFNREIPGLKSLMLDETQTRILHSLKWHKTLYDIKKTANPEIAFEKKQWLDEWERSVLLECNETNKYIMKSERFLYANIKENLREHNTKEWLYLITIELDLFKPYYLLDVNQIINKNVKYKSNYLSDVFCEKQDAVSQSDIKNIQQAFSASKSELTNKKAKNAIGATAAVAVTAASGGLALAFAPEIAVALVGGSFAGLSGAALTSASLAAVGFGSLAAGGLGMAGGTAIIAGGGTLLGVVGSGAVTLSAKAFLSSKVAVLDECAKLITFCKEVLLNKYCNREMVLMIQGTVEKNLHAMENAIERADISDDVDVKKHKKLLENAKISLKYIKHCNDQLLDAIADKEMIILSEIVNKLRKEHPDNFIWGRFVYKKNYIFIVSPNKVSRFPFASTIWYSFDRKTKKLDIVNHYTLNDKEYLKMLKSMEKSIILMDLSKKEFDIIKGKEKLC